ncbi:hypothetical protein [Serratia marcescens]|uniref:hypothetical protein n=1 Tax=Serratia marcescens TaxID=615 RepID=UPI003D6F1252
MRRSAIDSPRAEKEGSADAYRSYRLPAYEIATLIHLQFGAPAPALITDRRPLSLLWQRKASWEYALDALSQLTPQTTDNASRLAWLLTREHHGLALAPLEQKRNKQGWSKGRPVALKRLRESADTLPWLLSQDRQAARHIHYTAAYSFYGDNGSYSLDAQAALPLLAGHPAVYWHDAPGIRVDIEPGQVTLVLSEVGNQLALQLTPAINDSQSLVTEKQTPTRLVVYPVSDELRRIAGIIGRGLRIPASAREKVLQTVAPEAFAFLTLRAVAGKDGQQRPPLQVLGMGEFEAGQPRQAPMPRRGTVQVAGEVTQGTDRVVDQMSGPHSLPALPRIEATAGANTARHRAGHRRIFFAADVWHQRHG